MEKIQKAKKALAIGVVYVTKIENVKLVKKEKDEIELQTL